MWPFKRKKTLENSGSGLPCSLCGSKNTVIKSYHGMDQPDYIRTWRGQRFVTCRCLNCNRDFYAEEPPLGLGEETLPTDDQIDEDELRSAEDEVKREMEEKDDHRFG